MSIIQRGFRSKLTEQNLTIKIKVDGSFTCDFTCFGVDSDNKLSDERYMIFYNQLSSPNGEITLANSANNASFAVNLDQLPANINKLAFTATIDGDGTMMQMQNLHLEIIPKGGESFEADLTGTLFAQEKALIVLEIYRKDVWRLNLVAQGFNGGLSDLLKHYGGVEDSSSAPAPAPTPEAKPEFKPNLHKISLEKRLEEKAPALIDLAKPIKITLEKKKLSDVQARVALVIDASGSMYHAYRDGTVQQIVNKILPLAVQFDDDGELDLWIFSDRLKRMPSTNLDNYESIVPKDPHVLKLGVGNKEPIAIKEVIDTYKNSELPAYVVFISDGGVYYDDDIKKLLISSSILPIFWQFVGVAGNDYGILEDLDTMEGRYVDNANFFSLDDFNSVPNQELYDRLLNEFPQWLKEAKSKGVFDPAVRESMMGKYMISEQEKTTAKKGFFSRIFG